MSFIERMATRCSYSKALTFSFAELVSTCTVIAQKCHETYVYSYVVYGEAFFLRILPKFIPQNIQWECTAAYTR